jgi:hypothetical protein
MHTLTFAHTASSSRLEARSLKKTDMKKCLYICGLIIIVLTSCKDDEVAIFDKTADERVAEAISNLKQELIAPANGWRIKYRPEAESGSYYILMDFNDDNTVTIKSDLGYNDGEFFEQTVTYRIDNSLGLELIIESYSFFSFLFEQGQATFLAEYEFNFVNKTPDNALVFNSKTDPGVATILLFEEAGTNDIDLLATKLSTDLNTMSEDFLKWSSSFKLTYQDKNLAFYIVLDNFRRIISFNSASLKTNTSTTESVSFSSPYILKGDSIVFDSPFTGTVLNNNVAIKGIRFTTLSEGSVNICTDPITTHLYQGTTSANDIIALETTLSDASGSNFAQASDFYFSPLQYISNNGVSAAGQIVQDLTGAGSMQLYYDFDIGSGTPFYAIGFYLQNSNGTATFALREFTPTLTDNNIVFNFEPDISIFGDPNPDADTTNVNIYLNALTDGGNTYVFELQDNIYEFYNPCTNWSVLFFDGNQ